MILYVLAEIENETDQQFMLSLYEKYKPIMFGTVRKYVSDYFVIEDLVQDSLVKLIPKIATLKELERCKLEAYIVYTVRNTAFNYLRKKANEKQYITFEDSEDLIFRLRTSERYTEEKLESIERKAELHRMLSKLPERDQDALIRKYYLRQSDQEISVVYGCKPNSVRMVLTRIRRRVLDIMTEEGVGYEKS